MRDNTVLIDDSAAEAAISFSPRFNVAVPFIDRHIEEGRGMRIAIRTAEEDVTYGELAERVNRCGNLLKSMDLAAGDRVLMIVRDCPEFVYLFWGAIKAGFVPVPLNTLLRAADYHFMIEDSG
ncbi:MAG: AMP-binding protein, partial [Hyphomicrobiales bacterium]|nr:AMP-binding protein [Hyphomicrobiales bacterium]